MGNRIHYLCNGEKEDCKKNICYKTIGDNEKACKYTRDVRYAKNFSKKRPEIKDSDYWEEETAPVKRVQSEN